MEVYWNIVLFTVPKNSNIGGLNIGSQSFNKFIISKIPALANKGGDLFAELLRFIIKDIPTHKN